MTFVEATYLFSENTDLSEIQLEELKGKFFLLIIQIMTCQKLSFYKDFKLFSK